MALPNDMSRLVQTLAQSASSSDEYDNDSQKKLCARTLIRRSYTIQVAAVNANGNNIVAPNAAPVHRMIANGRILGGYFVPQSTATAAGADNAVLAIKSLHAANGATNVTLATQTTNTVANGGVGNLAVGVAVELTVNSNTVLQRFTKGTLIGATVTMAGNGVAMGAGTYVFDVELEGPSTDYPV